MKKTRSNWFETYTGRQVWPTNLAPGDIDILDIAAHLSKQCRFLGATREFYSVAQHSVIVSRIVRRHEPSLAFLALMHDATEAYVGDMIRPLKRVLPAFQDMESSVWEAIATRFEFPIELPQIVHDADAIALVTERRDLLKKTPHLWSESLDMYRPDKWVIDPMGPVQAEGHFNTEFLDLCPPHLL